MDHKVVLWICEKSAQIINEMRNIERGREGTKG